jgi:hypothetical protein
MPLGTASPAPGRRRNGFALIIVLWSLVLIAFIVAHLTASGRTETRIAGNLVANAVAQAAADGAVFTALFNLSNAQPEQRWAVDGSVRELVVGGSWVNLRVEDEAWWVNPNTASAELIEALLRSIGGQPESARRLAAVIGEWVGSAPAPSPSECCPCRLSSGRARLRTAGGAAREPRRTRPGTGHDPRDPCGDPAASDALWTAATERGDA